VRATERMRKREERGGIGKGWDGRGRGLGDGKGVMSNLCAW
jgi:hypothetical protein